MIPFFRKIRYRLAKDNQFLKYSRYAIGEIVLVVVGILIALQINNWNENNKIRNEELKALIDLKNEFKENHKDLISIHKSKKASEQNMRDFIHLLVSDSLSIEQKSKLDRPDYNGFTLDANYVILKSLISTGKIDHFKNDSLKYHLTDWTNHISYYKYYENQHLEIVTPRLGDFEIKNIPSKIFRNEEWKGKILLDDVWVEDLDKKKAMAIDNLEYQNLLISIANSLYVTNTMTQGLINTSNSLQKKINAEIENRKN